MREGASSKVIASDEQLRLLNETVNHKRFIYNHIWAMRMKAHDNGVVIPSDATVKKLTHLHAILLKNRDKKPWLDEFLSSDIGKDILAYAAEHSGFAFKRCYEQGVSKPPKPKRLYGSKASFTLSFASCEFKDNECRIPDIGWVQLAKPIVIPKSAKPKFITLIRENSRTLWKLSISWDDARPFPMLNKQLVWRPVELPSAVIGTGAIRITGIDAACGNEVAIYNDGKNTKHQTHPRTLVNIEHRIRGLRKHLDALLTSNGGKESKAVRDLRVKIEDARLREGRIRRESQLRANAEVLQVSDVIVIEELALSDMAEQNEGQYRYTINRAKIDDWRRYLIRDAERQGKRVVVAPKHYPSTQLCSSCRSHRHKMPTADRMFDCPECGASIQRDENAAKNLRHYGVIYLLAGEKAAKKYLRKIDRLQKNAHIPSKWYLDRQQRCSHGRVDISEVDAQATSVQPLGARAEFRNAQECVA